MSFASIFINNREKHEKNEKKGEGKVGGINGS
jgi:hypothetical protein